MIILPLLHKHNFSVATKHLKIHIIEIDSKHCEKQFGRGPFMTRDQVASLENANKY